jgi:hypothetical protein
MNFPTWQITLRRLGHPNWHYAQTQRRGREPEPGQLIVVRDIDGTEVKARIRSFLHKKPRTSLRGVYAVETEEVEMDQFAELVGDEKARKQTGF